MCVQRDLILLFLHFSLMYVCSCILRMFVRIQVHTYHETLVKDREQPLVVESSGFQGKY